MQNTYDYVKCWVSQKTLITEYYGSVSFYGNLLVFWKKILKKFLEFKFLEYIFITIGIYWKFIIIVNFVNETSVIYYEFSAK